MVKLTNMEFFAFHGCLESERDDGNRFRVDLEYDYDMEIAAITDDLEDAVNYADVYEVVMIEMGMPSNLLENVAHRILESLQVNFPKITSATVTVTKYNPPVAGQVGESSVTMSF